MILGHRFDLGDHVREHLRVLGTEVTFFTEIILQVEELPLLAVAHGFPLIHENADVGVSGAMAERVEDFAGSRVFPGEDVAEHCFAVEVFAGRDICAGEFGQGGIKIEGADLV